MKYITAQQLHEMTQMSLSECRKIINLARKRMGEMNYYVPTSRPTLAMQDIVFQILKNDKYKI